MKNIKKVAVLLAVVLLATMMVSLTASAAATSTELKTIELETKSVLLVDKSGSIEDANAIVSKLETASFDAVASFDTELSTDNQFAGGGNSSICEAIDKVADAGFTHITVVTDGEQWPADYSSLGLYTDLDLVIYLVEDETKEAEELVRELEGRLVNSNLKVVKPDGKEEVILNDYKAPIYSIEVPVVPELEDEGDKTFIQNLKEGYFPWWLILLLAAIIAAIFDFIHELITRGRRVEDKKEETSDPTEPTLPTESTVPAVAPMPIAAVAQIARGAHVLADLSGSMAAQQSETAKACMEAQKGSETVICFGDIVSEHTADEIEGLPATGKTCGWEAIEEAANKGWDDDDEGIVLVSDLGFNGKTFNANEFPKKFKKITVVTPSNYHKPTLENLKKIADEVEVLPL